MLPGWTTHGKLREYPGKGGVYHTTEYVSYRDIEEHDKLAAEDKSKLIGAM